MARMAVSTVKKLGFILIVIGLLGLGVFTLSLIVYRFDHPELTETQLASWSFARWYEWLVLTAIGGAGCWIVHANE